MINYFKIIIDQIKNLFTCFSIYLLSILLFLPLNNYFNNFQINNKYGKEFSITFLLSTLTFCVIYLFINNVRLFKSKFRILDLKLVLFSFLLPIIITYSISIVEKTSINFNYFNADIFFLFLSFFIYALFEEIICRFAMLSIYYNSTIKYFQIFSSSLMFSLFHFGNNSFDSIPFIVLFLRGIILAFIYLKTNLLTVTIVHALWNIASSIIIGGNVSGIKVNYSLFTFVHLQDNIINGGKFGIEGSIITLLILLSICLITILNHRNPTNLNVQD